MKTTELHDSDVNSKQPFLSPSAEDGTWGLMSALHLLSYTLSLEIRNF